MVSIGSLREQPLGRILSEVVPAQLREYKPDLVFFTCASMMACSLLLGGGTRGGFLSDAILELFAIPALLVAVSSVVNLLVRQTESGRRVLWAIAFCVAIAILPLLQLLPLPPLIWTKLPGREELEAIFGLAGDRQPWMPISVSPKATWLSFLSLLPPAAIFLAAIQLSYSERRRLSLLVIAVAVISAFVGLIQVAQGPESSLRFFSSTNLMEAVGFFANRNHFAALLYAALLFTAVWSIDVAFNTGSWGDLKRVSPFTIVVLTISLMIFIVLIAAEAVARSRAGMLLTIVALTGALGLAFTDRRQASRVRASKMLIGAMSVAILLSVQFTLYRILDRFAADPLDDSRIPFARNTIRAAIAFMPFGAGLGTFVPVYGMFEQPSDAMPDAYVNHAHNDILELWLETGVIGIVLALFFATWFVLSCAKVWRWAPVGSRDLDLSLARAATIIIGLLVAHSFVDYPLRTEAMMVIFAFSCALLIEPLRVPEKGARGAQDNTSQESTPRNGPPPLASILPDRSQASARAPEKRTVAVRQPGARWGEGIDWPDEWRTLRNDKASTED
jgi:O-antigen ligase